MTVNSSLKITNGAGDVSVDMVAMNPDMTVTLSNPMIDFAAPTVDIAPTGAASFNQYTFNIGFLTNGITITFTESGGVGSLYNTTRATVFEKLFYLSYFDKPYKKFYMNDTDYIPVAITSYRAHMGPGKKDIVEHTLGLVISNPDST